MNNKIFSSHATTHGQLEEDHTYWLWFGMMVYTACYKYGTYTRQNNKHKHQSVNQGRLIKSASQQEQALDFSHHNYIIPSDLLNIITCTILLYYQYAFLYDNSSALILNKNMSPFWSKKKISIFKSLKNISDSLKKVFIYQFQVY